MSQPFILVARDDDSGDHAPGISPLALSIPSCYLCAGLGTIRGPNGRHTCACVYRRVFRVCLLSYRYCQASMAAAGAVQCERVGHAQGRCAIIASCKRAEYAADFILLARRALVGQPVEMTVFEAYHLANLEWREAAARVNHLVHVPRRLTRNAFYCAARHAETLVGKAIVGTRPYSLFPPRQYFAGFTIPAHSLTSSRVRPR